MYNPIHIFFADSVTNIHCLSRTDEILHLGIIGSNPMAKSSIFAADKLEQLSPVNPLTTHSGLDEVRKSDGDHERCFKKINIDGRSYTLIISESNFSTNTKVSIPSRGLYY